MLFNSYIFILLFLPLVVVCCRWLSRQAPALLPIFFCAASLAFYVYWYPPNIIVLLFSTCANFLLGLAIEASGGRTRKWIFISAIALNLTLLGVFKYANFIIGNVDFVFGTNFDFTNIVLPLGISFYTFQKIAYVTMVHRGTVRAERSLFGFLSFVSFFPPLIAGPIVHYNELTPQLRASGFARVNSGDLALGISIFSVGLLKKVLLADNAALFASPVFLSADSGQAVDLVAAWGGVLAYTFQLYFDFSGYSDMAIGLAQIFGVRLPQNFNSPYKATSIIDFWRRWHITLSNFLRDFLYIALGGNRKGSARRYFNLMVTMLLGGLWHGASWNFVFWGGLHGGYLVLNQLWRKVWRGPSSQYGALAPWLLTFVAVVVGWVFFRAKTFAGAVLLLSSMAGMHGVLLPRQLHGWVPQWIPGVRFGEMPLYPLAANFVLVVVLAVIALACPNTDQMFRRSGPAIMGDKEAPQRSGTKRAQWQLSPRWAVAIGIAAGIGLSLTGSPSEFLYFQF